MAGIGINVRGHDKDVPGTKIGDVFKKIEQLILEDFHLPLAAVGQMKLNGTIQRGNGLSVSRRSRQGSQIQNVLLHLHEQGAPGM